MTPTPKVVTEEAKRSQMKEQLENFKAFLDTYTEEQHANLELRLEKIEKLWDKFDSVQTMIELATKGGETNTNTERKKFEDMYFEVVSKGRQLVKQGDTRTETNNASTVDNSASLRLPILNLPSFNGDYTQWLSFRDSFTSLIHRNQSLTDVDKFQYLRGTLKSEALQIIQGLETTSANYSIAWKLLEDRYENERIIINMHLKNLVDVPVVLKESQSSIRSMLDIIRSNINALKSLKEPVNSWDTLLIYLFINKLDIRNRQQWQEKIAKSKTSKPKLEDFLTFLEERAQVLEMSERIAKTEISKNQHSLITPKKITSFQSTEATHACEYCKGEHFLFRCSEFLKLSPESRYTEVVRLNLCINCLKPGHIGRKCNSRKCTKCQLAHNTLLHKDRPSKDQNKETNEKKYSETAKFNSHTVQQEDLKPQQLQILLSTAEILLKGKDGKWHHARALLDSGSQSNFIASSLAEKLKLNCMKTDVPVYGLNHLLTNINKRCEVRFKSKFNNFQKNLDCLVLSKITENLPLVTLPTVQLNIPPKLKLADPKFNISAPIDILIGSEVFWTLLQVGQIKLAKDQPLLQKSVLGWIIAGPLNINKSLPVASTACLSTNETLQHQIEKFWETEEIQEKRKLTVEDKQCEELFMKHTTREKDGRYNVPILKRENICLRNNFVGALKRFRGIEKRLHNEPSLKESYYQFMQQYESLNHMSEVKLEDKKPDINYLPHHPVIRADSITTKVRVVFDGSFKDTSGICVNDQLYVGPKVQDDLFNIILRFRTHEFVVTADIAMMFRQILIRKQDRQLQQIIWREDGQDLKTFQLNTVTYGTASAPYLAARCLKQLAIDDGNEFPMAKEALLNDFYMDDVLSGTRTKEQAIELQSQLSKLLKKGQFELRKWRSNCKEVLEHLIVENKDDELLVLNKEDVKTLGVSWNSYLDTIHFNLTKKEEKRITKRNILSQIATIFDPLGLIGPVTIKAKVMMQELWKLDLKWDESVPQHIFTTWRDYHSSLHHITRLEIPRNINPQNSQKHIDLHGFCDSSMKANGACVYATSLDEQQNKIIRLICAKSRVAPLKTNTLPRLELCGALVLARLISVIQEALKNKINNIYLWTDSTIVLAWLKTSPQDLKTYVANRTAEIQSLTKAAKWMHVKSSENPADLISRGLTANEILNSKLWWTGPNWLETNDWPMQNEEQCELLELKRKPTVSMIAVKDKDNIFYRYSSMKSLLRIVAYCKRFISACKSNYSNSPNLTVEELNKAEETIIREIQRQAFPQEFEALKSNKPLHKKSKLLNLHPYLDEKEIIRVGGRIHKAEVSTDQRHPMILPKDNHVTEIIMQDQHNKLKHYGPEQLLATVRLKFWPMSGRKLAKNITRKCHSCFKLKPRPAAQLLGNLPKERVTSMTRPFEVCGIDYAGPIIIRESKRRGRIRTSKAYIAIFVCFSTKAVHIELVSELTSECFLAALRRFTARRGLCRQIFSDNGTNFIGANKKLKDVHEFLERNNEALARELANSKINWKFIPPRAPHFGALWEITVKSCKSHFMKVTQNAMLTFEECSTLLTEIEAILNCRPLTSLSSSPDDLTPLTPSHFLIGDSLVQPVETILTNKPIPLLSRWQHLEKMKHHFWQRWHKEYLHQLQTRTKWKQQTENLEPGTMVVVMDDNIPVLRWRIGRITKTFPGEDGCVRVVLVKTSTGEVKRPVTKVCVLPNVF